MQLLLTAAQLSSLPSAAVAKAQTLETRADHELFVHWVNVSPYMFLLVDREGQTRTPVMPYSEGTHRMDLKHRSDNVYFLPVVAFTSSNPIQGLWAEVTDKLPTGGELIA